MKKNKGVLLFLIVMCLSFNMHAQTVGGKSDFQGQKTVTKKRKTEVKTSQKKTPKSITAFMEGNIGVGFIDYATYSTFSNYPVYQYGSPFHISANFGHQLKLLGNPESFTLSAGVRWVEFGMLIGDYFGFNADLINVGLNVRYKFNENLGVGANLYLGFSNLYYYDYNAAFKLNPIDIYIIYDKFYAGINWSFYSSYYTTCSPLTLKLGYNF